MKRTITPTVFPAFVAILAGSAVQAQEFRPFDLGKVYRDAATIKAMRAETRAIELENQMREELERRGENPEPGGPLFSSDEAQIMSRFDEAIRYRRFRWDDFDQVVFAPDLMVTLDMIALMAESRYAADIAYYLGQNPEKSAAIARMPLLRLAARSFQSRKKLPLVRKPLNRSAALTCRGRAFECPILRRRATNC